MNDEDIVYLFEQRHENGIAEVNKKYGKLCYKVARNILNNCEDVEECIQDTYLGVWNNIPPEKPKSLKNYICLMTRNLSLKKFHHSSAKKRNSFYDIALDELENVLTNNETPEDLSILKEYQDNLNVFLKNLDRENRSIFVLRYWYSEPIIDIAKQFNCSENAISSRLKRTRKKLKDFLNEMEETI